MFLNILGLGHNLFISWDAVCDIKIYIISLIHNMKLKLESAVVFWRHWAKNLETNFEHIIIQEN